MESVRDMGQPQSTSTGIPFAALRALAAGRSEAVGTPISRILSTLFGRARLPVVVPEPGARRVSGKPAQGVPERGNPKTRTIVVRVDEETFRQLRIVAVASDVSVTEAIRQLIKRGLAAPTSSQ
jgi:hypothetical protein